MKAKLNDKGDALVLELPFDKRGVLSGSGKSMVHASTKGNVAIALGDKQYSVGVNCYAAIPKQGD